MWFRIGAMADEFANEMEAAPQDISELSATVRKDTWLTRVEYMSMLIEIVCHKK
jgi:hypothetical protein